VGQPGGRFRLAGDDGMSQRHQGMAEMTAFDRQRLIMALILLVMAAFVASGRPGVGRWRHYLRAAAIAGFAAAMVLALIEVSLWWTVTIP